MSDQNAGAPAPDAPKRAAPPTNRALIAVLSAAFVVGALSVAVFVRQPAVTPASDVAPASPLVAAVAKHRSPASAETSSDGSHSEWTGSTRPRWARDGSKMIEFDHAAARDVAVWMKRVRPVLAVRCLYGRTEVFVIPDTAASIESNDHHTVRVRFDDGPDVGQSWADSEDSQELFAPDGVAMARQLAKARTMQFAFTPYNAAPVVVDFDVQGFDQLVGIVAKTCKWIP
jgi:hypothetical protein